MRIFHLFLLLCLFIATSHAAVGLVTVPERDVVRMIIYNAVDLGAGGVDLDSEEGDQPHSVPMGRNAY